MKQSIEIWKRIKSKKIADCRVFRVREDFCERASDRQKASFFVVENPDWVNVIALTRSRKVVLIEQFRHGSGEIILEIPGGMIDENELPETAARRELLEETGYSSENFILLGKSQPNPAIQNNTIFHFLAIDCEKTAETSFDEHESLMTKLSPVSEIENLIKSDKITHSLVLAAFHKFNLYKASEFAEIFDVDETKVSKAEDYFKKILLLEGYESIDAESLGFYITNILRIAVPLLNRLNDMKDFDIENVMDDIHTLFANKHSFDDGKRILMWENKE